MSWTHPICEGCYQTLEGRRPHPHKVVDPNMETCCVCGQQTNDGIFYRAKPGSFPYCPKGDP